MFNNIIRMNDDMAVVRTNSNAGITMNQYVVFEDSSRKVLGEIVEILEDSVKVNFLGEFSLDKFLGGTVIKPRINAVVRVANEEELGIITGSNNQGFMKLGMLPFYENKPLYLEVNKFFNNHFAIVGGSGVGKSCGVSTLLQNLFLEEKLNLGNANIIIFDVLGEYYNAFSSLGKGGQYNYKYVSTALGDNSFRIPIHLLNADCLALLLRINSNWQFSILQKLRKYAVIFSQEDSSFDVLKNYLMAKSIMDVLYSNEFSYTKRNAIMTILGVCSTAQFSMETVIAEGKTIGSSLTIDANGYMVDTPILTEYVRQFINADLSNAVLPDSGYYTVKDLEKYLNFTFISTGILKDSDLSNEGVFLKAQLRELIMGKYAKYFADAERKDLKQFVDTLFSNEGSHSQIVNINLADVDEVFATSIIKIFSKIIFEYAKGLGEKVPFHLIIEDADKYICSEEEKSLVGYDIFEIIAREGSKCGVILGLVSERPSAILGDVFSKCVNVLAFRSGNNSDIQSISTMCPNFNTTLVEKISNLQAGTCVVMGPAFRVPSVVRLSVPEPGLTSVRSDVTLAWSGLATTSEFVLPNPFMQMSTDAEATTAMTLNMVNSALSSNNVTPAAPAAESPVQNGVIPTAPVENVNQLVTNTTPLQDASAPLNSNEASAVNTMTQENAQTPSAVTSTEQPTQPATQPPEVPQTNDVVLEVPSLASNTTVSIGAYPTTPVPMPNVPGAVQDDGAASDIFASLAPKTSPVGIVGDASAIPSGMGLDDNDTQVSAPVTSVPVSPTALVSFANPVK